MKCDCVRSDSSFYYIYFNGILSLPLPDRVLSILHHHRSIICYCNSSSNKRSCLINSSNHSIIWRHHFLIFCFRKTSKDVRFSSTKRNIPTRRATRWLELKTSNLQTFWFQPSRTSKKSLRSLQIPTRRRIPEASSRSTTWFSRHHQPKNSAFSAWDRAVIRHYQIQHRVSRTRKRLIFNGHKRPLTWTRIPSCPAFKRHIRSSTINSLTLD